MTTLSAAPKTNVVCFPRSAIEPVCNPVSKRGKVLPDGVVRHRPVPVLAPSPNAYATLLTAVVASMPRSRQAEVTRRLRRLIEKGDLTACAALDMACGYYGMTV